VYDKKMGAVDLNWPSTSYVLFTLLFANIAFWQKVAAISVARFLLLQ
jgi:hypothetical protein